MSKRKISAGVVTIILLLVGSVWAFRSRSDPEVEKVKEMIKVEAAKGTVPTRQTFDVFRKQMDQLTPDQRQQVMGVVRETMERRMDQEVKHYFSLPPKERVAHLDKQINEMEKRRKEWEARRAQSGAPGGGTGGQQASAGGGGRPGGQGGPGAGGQGRPPRPAAGSDAALQRRDARLDNSTAQQRAQRSAYFADMRARRIQLGLPPSPFPGGRGPR
jgi:hypothetical protein